MEKSLNLIFSNLRQYRLFVVALFILWFLLFLGHSWEEGLKMDAMIESAIAKKLLSQSDWTILRFAPSSYPQGFYDHPPLLAWVEAVFFKIFGVSDSVARIPPALFALGTTLGVIVWGSLSGGLAQGLLAAFILLTSNRFIKFASDVLLEGPLSCFFVWGCVCVLWGEKKEGMLRALLLFVFGVFLGLAFLTKSVFSLFLIVSLAFSCFFARIKPKYVVQILLMGMCGFSLVIGWWILNANGWNFIQNHFSTLSGRAQHREWGNVFIPIKNILSTYWPWFPFFMMGCFGLFRNYKSACFSQILAASQFFVIVLCLSTGNQIWEHYLILCLPPAAVVSAKVFQDLLGLGFENFEKIVFSSAVFAAVFLACYPLRIRRERMEPLGTTLKEMEAVCHGQKEILVTREAMSEWLAMAVISWKTSYEGKSVTALDSIPEDGQLLVTNKNQRPESPLWVKVPLALSVLDLYQSKQNRYCR